MHRSTASLLLAVATLLPAIAAAQLQSVGTQFWHQGSPGAGGGVAPVEGASYGRALSSGDYNCDGLNDVAFGMPRDDFFPGVTRSGRVQVLYANADGSGLGTDDRQVWARNSVPGEPSAFADFGGSLASGDFNNDGCDDLAIGVPFDDVDGIDGTGSVNVLYGSASVGGLWTTGIQYWDQNTPDVASVNEAGDNFGAALAVGDFNADGFDDLAIGVPGESVSVGGVVATEAGQIQLLYGSASGLTSTVSDFLRRGNQLSGTPTSNERLGSVLAAGNVNGAEGDELVIGIPLFDLPGLSNAGAIMIVTDLDGLVLNVTYTQGSNGIPGVAEAGDQLGSALALGDFDGDGFVQIAAAASGEDIEQPAPARDNAGAVNIFDLVGNAHDLFTQDDFTPEQAEDFDNFGDALVAADFDGDGVDDLAIGVSGENLGPIANGGLVHVIYGLQGAGLNVQDRQTWLQTIDPPDTQDRFGSALAAGPINAGPQADLVIGAPGNTVGMLSGTGSATVLYSRGEALFADGFESP
jgi:hypothetical protein